MLRNNLLQYLIHDATLNLSAAKSTSSKAVARVADKVLLYIKLRRSNKASSSVPAEQIGEEENSVKSTSFT
jgi:hypothetical protein